MNDRDQRRYDRLTRVQTFGRENSADTTAGSNAATLFASIDQRITALEAAKSGQAPERVSKQTLLDALWLDFKDIARTARAIALTENGFASAYRTPADFTEKDIATHADALLGHLESSPDDTPEEKAAKTARRQRFIAYEIASDFVTDLRADREALRQANQLNQGETQEGVENTKLIGEILEAAALDVQQLDATMQNRYARRPEKLRVWQTASRVERAPQRAKTPPPPAGQTTPKPPVG